MSWPNPPLSEAMHVDSRALRVQALRQQLQVEPLRFEGGSVVSSGHPGLDAILPHQGFRRGSLVEWFGMGWGTGASVVAWWAATTACRAGGILAVFDLPFQQDGVTAKFYPPAVGLPAHQILIVRPQHTQELVWSLDQVLRCPAIAAIWVRIEHLSPRDFRRLQLSAEEGKALACLIRPRETRGLPSWSDLQIEVQAHGATDGRWQAQLQVVRGRGLARSGSVQWEWSLTGHGDE